MHINFLNIVLGTQMKRSERNVELKRKKTFRWVAFVFDEMFIPIQLIRFFFWVGKKLYFHEINVSKRYKNPYTNGVELGVVWIEYLCRNIIKHSHIVLWKIGIALPIHIQRFSNSHLNGSLSTNYLLKTNRKWCIKPFWS